MTENRLRLLEQTQEYDSANSALGLTSSLIVWNQAGVNSGVTPPDIHEVKGYRFLGGAPASTWYYPLFQLPPSTAGTNDCVILDGVINQSWGSGSTALFTLMAGNRNGLTVRFNKPMGPVVSSYGGVGFQAFSQANGAVIFYAWIGGGQYTFQSFDLKCMHDIGQNNGSQIWTPAQSLALGSTTVPTGNSVWNSDTSPGGFNYNAIVWQTPTLAANVANYGGGFNPAGYYLDAEGRVFLRGLITGSGLAAAVTLFTLPTAYTPPNNHLFSCPGSNSGGTNGMWRVDVQSGGAVVYQNQPFSGVTGGPVSWFSLDGISFLSY